MTDEPARDLARIEDELRFLRQRIDEVRQRMRGSADRLDLIGAVLVVVGLVVFAVLAVLSFSAGHRGVGLLFSGLAAVTVPILVVAGRRVTRLSLLSREHRALRRREAEISQWLARSYSSVPVVEAETAPLTAVDRALSEVPTAPASVEPSQPPRTRESGQVPWTRESGQVPRTRESGQVPPTRESGQTPQTAEFGQAPRTGRPPAGLDDPVGFIEAALPAYVVRRELGEGGCGVVFLAEHRRAGWLRALKLMTDRQTLSDSQSRFLREAQMMEGLNHPHIARVYEYVEHEGLNVIVLEFLAGGSVADRAGELLGRAEPVCALGLAVADALAAAHAKNVVHRDIKPGNLLYAEDGLVKVTDFGIAKLLAGPDGEPASILALTPGYAAPEQMNADQITSRTDLYALAATLYRLLTGRTPPLPAADGSPRANMSGVPLSIAAVLERSLHAFPDRRHGSAVEFALDLAEAASQTFSPGWLERAGVPFRGAERVRAAASGR